MIKKILSIILGIACMIPQVTNAFSAAIPWVATTTTPSLVQPGMFNGTFLTPYAQNFIASSTTKTSIFPYASSTATTATNLFSTNASITYASSTYITAVMASTSQAIFAGGPWVDARSCGAKGDGVTDDSAAINSCITDLSTNKGGGKLYISAAPTRSATTKYNICAGSIIMKPYIDVEVQRGVEIQVCNGFATSTVAFPSNTNGTYFAHWKGGTFSEAGTGKKLWTAFNVESQNINGGVFWNTISDVVINLPSVCIRSSIIGGASGWLNSNTYRDIVCNDPTNAWTFNDDRTGAFVIDETLFDNVQVQSNVSTETCFGDLKAWNTQLINAFCYDMNATSTSLNINQASLSTLIEGGYLTSYNFVDNGQRTVMVGDRLWPIYATSTLGSMYMYANGAVLFGTTTTNATLENVNVIDAAINLGIGTSKQNSKIEFYRGGAGDWQQDYMKAATTSSQNPNSGDIGISARQDIVMNIDSDSTSASTFFMLRNDRSDVGNTATNQLFKVDETGLTTMNTATSTTLSVSNGAFFNTSAGAASFQPVMVGSTTPPLFTTGALAPLSVFRKENTVVNTFYPVILAGENSNASAVISGGGPCYGYYLGSNITGRTLAMDCTMYDNTISFTAGAKINFVTDANGNFLPYMRVNRLGNIVFGATTTDPGNSVARVTALNPVSSAQDLFHGDQGTGTATTTVFAIKSTGFTGIATSSPHEALTVNGNAYIAGFVTSTSTTKSSTFPYASSTALTATNLFSTTDLTTNLIAMGSSTLQDFTGGNATTTNATTTNLAASSSICLAGDCRNAWPSPGGGVFPFTTLSNFNQTANSTTTALWLQGTPFSLFASSTAVFTYASSTMSSTIQASSTNQSVDVSLGIGTTTPWANLSVLKVGSVPPFIVATTTGSVNSYGPAIFVDTNGKVSIGTSSPTYGLQTLNVAGNILLSNSAVGGLNGRLILIHAGTADNAMDYVGSAAGNSGTIGASTRQAYVINIDSDNNSSSNAFAIRHDKATIDALTTGELFRVDELGHVGISTSTPFAALDVATTSTSAGGFAPQIAITDNGAGANLKHWTITNTQGILYIGTSTDVFASSTPSAVTVQNNGAFLIGSSTNNALGLGGLGISGKMFANNLTNSNTGDYVCFNTVTGEIEQSSTACSLSSLRWKQNVRPLTYGLNEILKLNPVLYDLKPQYGTAKNQPGFIAEEAVKVVPNLVPIDKEGKPASFDYPKLTSVLTKAIQEFYQRFQALVVRVSGAEKKIDDQQKEIDALKQQIKDIVDKNGLTN